MPRKWTMTLLTSRVFAYKPPSIRICRQLRKMRSATSSKKLAALVKEECLRERSSRWTLARARYWRWLADAVTKSLSLIEQRMLNDNQVRFSNHLFTQQRWNMAYRHLRLFEMLRRHSRM